MKTNLHFSLAAIAGCMSLASAVSAQTIISHIRPADSHRANDMAVYGPVHHAKHYMKPFKRAPEGAKHFQVGPIRGHAHVQSGKLTVKGHF